MNEPREGGRLILMGLVVMAVVGVMLLAHSSPGPMVCQVWSWTRGDWKPVQCIERPHVRWERVKPGSPIPATGIPATATATEEWEPWSTSTRTATVEPYPVETATVEPYP